MSVDIDKVKNYLLDLQTRNCDLLEKQDGIAKAAVAPALCRTVKCLNKPV